MPTTRHTTTRSITRSAARPTDGSAVPGPLTGETGPDTAGGATPGGATAAGPANRAERRAAKRGRSGAPGGPAAPRTAGPAPQARPAHVRTDFAARRSG